MSGRCYTITLSQNNPEEGLEQEMMGRFCTIPDTPPFNPRVTLAPIISNRANSGNEVMHERGAHIMPLGTASIEAPSVANPAL